MSLLCSLSVSSVNCSRFLGSKTLVVSCSGWEILLSLIIQRKSVSKEPRQIFFSLGHFKYSVTYWYGLVLVLVFLCAIFQSVLLSILFVTNFSFQYGSICVVRSAWVEIKCLFVTNISSQYGSSFWIGTHGRGY